MPSLTFFFCAASAFLFVHIFSTVYRSGLRKIPGPWLAKFSNLYRVGMVRRGRFSYELVELHRRYGPNVRLGPDSVSLTDREVVQDIYGFRTDFGKSDWVKSSQTLYKGQVVPALMTTQDKEYHSTLKKSIASAYSVTTLMGYEPSVEEVVRLFLQRLDDIFVRTGEACPLDKWLQWYAYDVIGAITMSRPMGFLEQGLDVDDMLGEIQAEAEYRAVGAVMPLIDWLYRKNSLVTFFSAPTHKIMVRARQMLQDRLAQPHSVSAGDDGDGDAAPRDFIARFLDAKEKHPETLNNRNMLGFVGSNLQAGSDTTAIALRTIVYFALKKPEVWRKMQEEVDAAAPVHPIPFQSAFNDFPYVGAVIQEALRIHPPFALLLERTVPPSGLALPDGNYLPPGTNVGMFGYTMHLDPEIYGSDAEEFHPERWLPQPDEDKERSQERIRKMQAADMSFGHGQRRCIGVHVAELQIYKLIPALVGLLDIELVNPERPWQVRQMFFSLQSDMEVRIKWRTSKGLQDFQLEKA